MVRGIADLRESELAAEDREEIERALPDVLRDTPKTESAALRIKRLLPKVGTTCYDLVIKVLTDLTSEYAKKTMGLK